MPVPESETGRLCLGQVAQPKAKCHVFTFSSSMGGRKAMQAGSRMSFFYAEMPAAAGSEDVYDRAQFSLPWMAGSPALATGSRQAGGRAPNAWQR